MLIRTFKLMVRECFINAPPAKGVVFIICFLLSFPLPISLYRIYPTMKATVIGLIINVVVGIFMVIYFNKEALKIINELLIPPSRREGQGMGKSDKKFHKEPKQQLPPEGGRGGEDKSKKLENHYNDDN